MKLIQLSCAGLVALIVALAPAFAADIPVKAPAVKAPAAAPIFDWSGFYVGLNAGYAWGRTRATDVGSAVGWGTQGTRWSADGNGFTGGLQAGARMQTQNWVLGIEGDLGYLDRSARTIHPTACCPPGDPTFLKAGDGWFATLRGSAGVLLAPTVLVYGTGGVIYADTRSRVFRPSDMHTPNADGWGWTAGAGAEFAVDPRWSWKVEYLYYDLGTDRVFDPTFLTCGAACNFDIRQTGHIVRAGVNYRFASGKMPAPVVTRY
jgi:outer membrane immunogenic protein